MLHQQLAAAEVDVLEVDADELAELTAQLPKAARLIRKWVKEAQGDDLELLQALDLRVTASKTSVVIEGAVPALDGEGHPTVGLPVHIDAGLKGRDGA